MQRAFVTACLSAWMAITAILGSPTKGLADASDAAVKHERPPFYAFCVDLPRIPQPSITDQTRLLARLGFDGVGYPLWLDGTLETNLRTIDDARLQLFLAYVAIDLKATGEMPSPALSQAIRQLKGRPTIVCVLLRGYPPEDPRAEERAVRLLRSLGDVAAEANVRISIYHHVNDWTQSLAFALKIVDKVDHPRVGVNFNLCHWLKVDGDKDYVPVLRSHAKKLFAVTINGAELGAQTWTNGLIQPLDRGDFDNQQLLRVLREIGYTGPIGLMCYGIPDEAEDHLKRSMAVWRGLW